MSSSLCSHCQNPIEPGLSFCVHCGKTVEEISIVPQECLDNRYQCEKLLGQGGMGQVFLAKDLQTQQYVAVKMILPHLSHEGENLERFDREIQALQSITHPNIIAMLNQGTYQGRRFYVMPFLEGCSLQDMLDEKPINLEQSASIITKILSALHALHQAGWIHRDIKAENIFMIHQQEPMLMDLGIARASNTQSNITMMGDVVGTVASMAPEQIVGGTIDARTDIYQVGMLLLTMLMGKPVFEANSTQSWYGAHLTATPTLNNTQENPKIIQLSNICLKAMHKDPKDRYATAREMQKAIENMNMPTSQNNWFKKLLGRFS